MTRRSQGGRARYLLRFDDICPTTDWNLWSDMEEALIEYDVRPMLAVVPDNQDDWLVKGPADLNFWNRVRAWQARGWTIGLHGYQHRYVTESRGLVGLNRYSEFAGLPLEEQRRKLSAGLGIFRREGVRADVWIAPAHTFDLNTLRALRELGVDTISDGFERWPHLCHRGFFWVPQQLGDFRRMLSGVWTICLHLDDPAHGDVTRFRRKVEQFREWIVDLPAIQREYRGRRATTADYAFAQALKWTKQLRRNRYLFRTDETSISPPAGVPRVPRQT